MRKVENKLEEIIKKISLLKGQDVEFEVTRGRKKALKFQGVIESVYPSIFTVKDKQKPLKNSYSYSYADVLCGDVCIKQE